jgi:U3 small nucleolar RNA-associated protein 6
MQYIEFARREKANRKLSQIFTDVLRMHPTKSDLWIYAAQYAIDVQADMTAARGYMQRGLRFSKAEKHFWLEYAKLEMMYVAKIAARRHILGLDKEADDVAIEREEDDGDKITLPKITAADIKEGGTIDSPANEETLARLKAAPALAGAIPMAIFDAAMKHFSTDDTIAFSFFSLFASFEQVPCLHTILQHVLDYMRDTLSSSPNYLICYARQPIVGLVVTSPDFPSALGVTLKRLKSGAAATQSRLEFTEAALLLIASVSEKNDIEGNLRAVLSATLRSLKHTWDREKQATGASTITDETVLRALRSVKLGQGASALVQQAA